MSLAEDAAMSKTESTAAARLREPPRAMKNEAVLHDTLVLQTERPALQA